MHGVARSAKRQLSEQEKKRELKQIDQYKDLVAQVQQSYRAKDYSAGALTLTSTLLCQNPEFYTIWNYRRLILLDVFSKELSGTSDSPDDAPPEPATGPSKTAPSTTLSPAQEEISMLLKEDLTFLLPLQRMNPKIYWLWNHRSWLLNQASSHLPIPVAIEFWMQELGLVSKMLGRDDRNFHGWSYRRKVVEALEELQYKELVSSIGKVNEQDHGRSEADLRSKSSMAKSEFDYADKMVRSNLSNFSAWHHRMQQLRRMLDITDADGLTRRKAFDEEIALATEGVATDPADQSLWFHHQDLFASLEPDAKPEVMVVRDLTVEDRREYVGRQIETVKEIVEDNDDSKWVYQALLELAQLHGRLGGEVEKDDMRSWLDKLEKLDPLRAGRWRDLRQKLDL